MAPTSKPALTLVADTGRIGDDRITASGAIEVTGLVQGNAALDVSKLTASNATIDFSKELAQENQLLKAPPGTLIAYGKKGYSGWSFRLVPASGELAINNSTFGDPLYGVVKAAYVASTPLAPAGTAENTWQYSLDAGASWSSPVNVSASNRFVVPDGTYAAGQVRVRQVIVTPPAAPLPTGNLIQNGSFERGWTGTGWTPLRSLPGWTAADQFEIWGTGMTRPSDGSYLLELDYSVVQDSIKQGISTVKGATYTLQFDAKSRGGGNESIEVFWRGERISTVVSNKTNEWTTFSFTVTGSGGTDELMFREPASENNSLGALLDNVRLSVLSAPAAAALTDTTAPAEGLLDAFTVDTQAPQVSLDAPGGTDRVVSTQTGDGLVRGRGEAGGSVTLMTRQIRSEDYSAGVLPSWLRLDVPDPAVASVVLDTANGELDFAAKGRTNIWSSRDNAPFAWVSRPEVALNETWFIETRVRLDNRSQGETIAGLTFSNDRDGDFQFGAPSFYLDGWHYQGTNVSLQGLGNSNEGGRPRATVGGATTVSGDQANVYLRVEVTEKGSADDYRFFSRKTPSDPWVQVGNAVSYSTANARAALFYKTGGAKNGLASFDETKVGKLADVVLAADIPVAPDGQFTHALTDEQLKQLGQGDSKTLIAVQRDAAGNLGRSTEINFAVDTEISPVRILSIGGGDGKVSSEVKEAGKGPLKLQLDQYTGYWSSKLSELQSYVQRFDPKGSAKRYSVSTDVIDYTDDQGGFAGEMPYDRRWPAAEALNVWGTGGINNNFFVKIAGDFFVQESGNYRFRTYNDDGVFLLIDGQLVINDPTLHPEQVFTGDIQLASGNHQLELFFFENGGEASLEFSVSRFNAATGQWGAYALVGKDPSFQARSVLEADNLIEGEAAPGALVNLLLGDQRLATVTADASGRFRYAMSAADLALLVQAAPGVTVVATLVDAAGNASRSEPATIALGDTSPVVTIASVGGSDQLASTAVGDALVLGQGEPNLSVVFKSGGQLLGQIMADAKGQFSYPLTAENLEALGQGLGKTITASQTKPSGLSGSSEPFTFAVDTIAPAVVIESVGFGDGRVSTNAVERGQGPVTFTVDQYTGYRSNQLKDLQAYVASTGTTGAKGLYSVFTNVIDFTDDQGGFAGDLPYDRRWPAAEALNVWGTGGINNDFFARIHTSFFVSEPGQYRFRTYNDDGVFLLIDGTTVISDSGIHPEQVFTGDIELASGNHQLELFFFEYAGEASLEFSVSQYNSATNSWGPYQLVGQAPALRAQSIRRADNLVEGRAEPGRTVLFQVGEVELGRVTADSDGRFSYALSEANLAFIAAQKPAAQLVAVQLDAAGNRGISSPMEVSAKLTPPEVTITAIGGADSIVSSQPGDANILGTAEAGLPVSILFNGEVIGITAPTDTEGRFSYSLTDKDLARLGQGGPLQITARQQDDYGNIGSRLSSAFNVDTIAPTVSLPATKQPQALGGVDGVVSSQSGDALIAAQAEPDRDVLIRLNGNSLATIRTSSSGAFSYTLSPSDLAAIGQGLGKALELSQTDAAGNTGTSTVAFDVDTVAPEAPQILDVASGGVVSALPQDNAITGRAEPESLVSLFVGNSLLATVTASKRGQFTYLLSDNDLATLGQGSTSVVAQIADAAGNVARSAPYAFRVDTLAPLVPLLESVGGDDSTVSTRGSGNVTATVDNKANGLAEAASLVEIYSGTKLLGSTTAGNDGRFVYALTAPDLASIGQGERKTLRVRAIDAAGNASEHTQPFGFAVDTVPPQAPRLSGIGGKDGVLTSLDGDNLIVGSTEPAAIVDLRVLNGLEALFTPQPITADSKGGWSYAFTPEQLASLQAVKAAGGNPQIQAVSRDGAGNEGVSIAITPNIDVNAPQITLSPVGGADAVVSSLTGDNLIRGTAEANAFVAVLSGNTRLGEVKTGVDGSFSYALSATNLKSIGEGTDRVLTVSQVDKAGNVTALNTAAFAVDTIAPAKAVIRGLGGTDKVVTARSGDHVVTGTAEAGASIDIQFVSGPNRITLGTMVVPSGGQFSYTLTPQNLQVIRQGVGKSLLVTSQDAAGNRSESSAFGFSVEAIWTVGTAVADTLSLVSGVDAITGLGGADTFALSSLASGQIGGGQTPTFDRLTDLQIGVDRIDAPSAVASGAVRDLGTIQSLSTTHLGQLLSATNFPALGAAVFRQQDPTIGERTFLALNDSRAGFSSRTDAILEITGYTGSLASLAVV